ncbi:MAG: tetratricopeptide repeat protein [Planctomycetes bacterium]|nr:tetratricopeptide repeat protein [Planctomycetota bacterium]
MNTKRIVTGVLLAGLLIAASGCNETHAQKKKAMVDQWEKSTAHAQLPAVENMIEQGQIKKAKQALIKCIQTNPKEPQAFVLIGRIHAMEGRNDQARAAFEKAVKLDSQSDPAWHFLGALAVLEKDYDQATECYQKAIDLMPANVDYIIGLSDVYMEIDQLDKAQQIIDKGLSLQPQNMELMLSKARLYQQTGQMDEAIRIYEQARIMHGDIPQILEPAGYAHIAQGHWKQAAEKFDLLIKQYPEDDPCYNPTMRSLARCLYHSEQYASALFWYDKLSVVYRDDADICLDMAQAALGLSDAKRAAYCANRAIKAKPSWPQAYAVLGSAHYMQGFYEQSLKAFYKITTDDELAGFAWFMSGRCYQQLGRNRQANIAFERAEKLDPENPLIASFLKKTVHPL